MGAHVEVQLQPRLVEPKLGSVQRSTKPPRLCANSGAAAQPLAGALLADGGGLAMGVALNEAAPVPEEVPLGEGEVELEETCEGLAVGVALAEAAPVGVRVGVRVFVGVAEPVWVGVTVGVGLPDSVCVEEPLGVSEGVGVVEFCSRLPPPPRGTLPWGLWPH